MKPFRFLRTSSFKFTALYAVLFGTSSLIVFGILYWVVSGALRQQIEASVVSELSALEKVYRTESVEALHKTISDRALSGKYPDFYYLLQNKDGQKMAGAIPSLKPFQGVRDVFVPYQDMSDGSDMPDNLADHAALAMGRVLPGDYFLVVGYSTYRIDQPLEIVRELFFWVMAIVFLLAIGGGALLSVGFLRRVDNINHAVDAIVEGSLSERIPTSGTEDELDRLAARLNHMLDRIQALMVSVQQVSNNIAHDLRTPLGKMRQRLEVARKDSKTISTYEETVTLAIQDIDSILSTFGSLLRIANIEAKSRSASFSTVDLSELFQNIAETYHPVAEDMNKSIEMDIAPGISIQGDRDMLVQMLANLVENAIKHTPPGTRVRLQLHQTDRGPVGVLNDDGHGVPRHEREKIFERFYRLDSDRGTPGNGLGLALVKAVTDLHGASIRLADGHPGAQFTIQFRPLQT